jgi:hypothetical protein
MAGKRSVKGGVVRALTLRLPAIEAASGIVVGGICAVYLGPLALPVVEKTVGSIVLEETSRVGLSGFVIGLGGIAVSGFVLDMWKRLRHDQKKGGK